MEVVAIWIVVSFAVAALASQRGRSGVQWFAGSVLFSPLLAGIVLLCTRNLATAATVPSADTHVKCPDCAELVKREARVCMHCKCRLVPQ